MNIEIKLTADGSNTIYNRQLNEHYHSTFGAVQESMHVFIHAGLKKIEKKQIRIFEMGFGTGLNVLLTYLNRKEFDNIEYHSMELFPLDEGMALGLDYESHLKLSMDEIEIYKLIQTCPWNILQEISPDFNLKKINKSIINASLSGNFDLVYYDAFAPSVQPELWTAEIFEKIYRSMNPDAVLVTYCAKGDVRRAMQECGFVVERIPGPPGKFHMLRAIKK
jgi:tRNA U34 5-methylaminomethyl-2-thiouridine-forming methyltransferase MnmC